jgi:hypothetical protein
MNFAKGSFRLWVVVAVCWCSTIGWLSYDNLTSVRDLPLSGKPPPCKPDAQADGQTIVWDQCKPWQRDWSKTKFGNLPKDLFVLDDGSGWFLHDQPDWDRRVAAAGWIVLPPLFLLLLGFCGTWVLKGFRS